MKIPLVGFAPDLDQTTPGILTDCAGVVPTLKGIQPAPGLIDTQLPALATRCLGSAVGRKLDGTSRLFAGTQTKLYEATTNTWTDQTRVTGGDYTGGTESRWRFTQYGNVTLASNKSDVIQATVSGAFANLSASAIKAAIIETVNNQIMAFDTSEPIYGDSPDRWWVSGLGDHTNWIESVGNQVVTGRLTDTPGKIVAGKRLGDGVVAYKERSMYIGTYQGPPVVWGFKLVPGDIGTFSQEAVVNIGTAHLFPSRDDFWIFDGSRPQRMNCPLREWFFARLNDTYSFWMMALHDQKNSLIRWFYPSSSSTVDKGIVYHYKADRWAVDDRTIEAVTEYLSGGITWDALGATYTTWDDLPVIPYDSDFWVAQSSIPAAFNSAHKLQTFNGAPVASSFTTGDYGDEMQYSLLKRVTPKLVRAPATGNMTHYHRPNLQDALSQGGVAPFINGRFDILVENRWHRTKFDFTGDYEITGFDAMFEEGAGE